MPEFLTLQIPQKAYSLLLQHLPPVQVRRTLVETRNSINRITASAILSPEDTPSFHRSTVDGYAVRASDTFGASETLPAFFKVIGEVPMGSMPGFQLHTGEAALIHTGGALPEGSNAVVMLENSQLMPPADLEVYRATGENENVVRKGEDLKVNDVVFPAGVKLGPAQIGGLLALGILQVPVAVSPRVAILSSGDEVVSPEKIPLPGQVRDINSYALATLIESYGGVSTIMGIIPDRPELLEKAVRQGLAEADMVVITAGSSASTRDLTSEVINRCGKPGVLVHGINIRPGKPTIMGVCDGKPVIGLPGNPVSAIVIARMFITRLVARLSGMTSDLPFAGYLAQLTTNIASVAGREDWVPVNLRQESDRLYADPIFFKSSLIFTLAGADGLAYIPADVTGFGAGEQVTVIPLY